MARVFAELPEACRNTLAVAERCNLTLDFGTFHLPRYLVPDGHTLDSYLRELSAAGLRRRYGPTPGEAVEARVGQHVGVAADAGRDAAVRGVGVLTHFARVDGVSRARVLSLAG